MSDPDAHPLAGVLLDVAARSKIEPLSKALEANPTDVPTLFRLGTALDELGKFQAASRVFARIVSLHPTLPDAHFNKGNADAAQGELELAVAAYEAAIAIERKSIYLNNLGTALLRLGRVQEAIGVLQDAVVREPRLHPAHVNLIRALVEAEDWDQAVQAGHHGLSHHHESVPILQALAQSWEGMGWFGNAISCLEQALTIDPGNASLYKMLGTMHFRLGDVTEARKSYEQSLELDPSDAELHSNLGEVARKRGRLGQALDYQRAALQIDPTLAAAHSNLLLTMLYDSRVAASTLLDEARHWAAQHTATIEPLPPRSDRTTDRLRIGYVSGGFHNHPVGIFMEPVLRSHDPERVEVHCYADQEHEDERTARLRAAAGHWHDVSQDSNRSLALRIREDKIDILVDLCGHSSPNRLLAFSYRPAPIQITWIGYSATTGLQQIDYILGDRWVMPSDDEGHFVERVVRLPNHYVCFAPPEDGLPVAPPRPVPNGAVTLGCFNNRSKITPEVIDVWSAILRDASNAQLLLRTTALDDLTIQRELMEEFTRRGVAEHRVCLEGYSPREELLAAYRRVDLCLDPFPFNGGLTTLESLWMGVPVLSVRGNRFVGRVGESFLRGVGLEDLVASSVSEYHRRAVELVEDHERRETIRQGLRERLLDSDLCDTARFTHELEEVFRGLWHETKGNSMNE